MKNDGLSRRRFISGAAAGIATAGMAGLAPAIALADDNEKKNVEPGKIITRKLGKTGLDVPIVSMGVMNANNPGLVQSAYELGIRHFDTAAFYQYGRNEQMVGKVINRMGVRDKLSVATKIFTSDQREGLSDEQIAKKLMTLLDGSLGRLKFDHIDILYIHSVSSRNWVGNEGILKGLEAIKKSGKAKFVGISTHTRMAEVMNEMTKHDIYDVALTAINFTMANDKALLDSIAAAAKKGIGIVAMKTMAGGSRWPNPESRSNYSQETIINAAMKWVMRNENIHTSIPGFDNYDHMNQDFAISRDLKYSAEEKKFLDDNEAISSLGYCHQCQKCLASCPNDVNVPKLMRTHMYAAQYANFEKAKLTLNEIPKATGLANCVSCDSCAAQCANSVNIRSRIDELKLIYA